MALCKLCQKEADITPSFCLHSCVCSECFHSKRILCCPECSYPIYNYTSSKYSLNETIDTFVAPSDSHKTQYFIATVVMLLRSMRSYDEKIVRLFVESLQTLVKEIGDGCVLNTDQCEFLLKCCLSKLHDVHSLYMIQNFLVALCKYPWEINVGLGGCGVCYHGNFGTTPCIVHAANIVRRNINKIKTQNNFFA